MHALRTLWKGSPRKCGVVSTGRGPPLVPLAPSVVPMQSLRSACSSGAFCKDSIDSAMDR